MLRVLIVLFISFWLAVMPAQADDIAKASIDYSDVSSTLQSSPVPARLPKVLVYSDSLHPSGSFFAVGGNTISNGQIVGYHYTVQDSPRCRGALSCSIAIMNAELLTPDLPSIDRIYGWMSRPGALDVYARHAPHLPKTVQVPGTNQAVFLVPWVDGRAGAGWEQAVWEEGDYRYTIALKWGDANWLLQMVASALGIDNAAAATGWDALVDPVDPAQQKY